MADSNRSTGHVRAHLVNTIGSTTFVAAWLNIQTEPESHGRAATTVRSARTHIGWTAGQAAQLADALRSLPGADVRLRPVVDKIVVIWDGV